MVEDLLTVQNVENQGGGTREISVNQKTMINKSHSGCRFKNQILGSKSTNDRDWQQIIYLFNKKMLVL